MKLEYKENTVVRYKEHKDFSWNRYAAANAHLQ